MRARVIFNPTAKGDKARHFRDHLDEIARDATLASTTCAGDARRLAAQAVLDGCDTIVAAGGDGTLNEVLNGIGDVPDGFARVRLGVLPLGTVNVFARELKIPTRLSAAWKTILEGRSFQMDLPIVNYESAQGAAVRYFLQLGGAGFDARAIELTNWAWKKKVGPLAYVAAGLKCMTEKHCSVEVEIENRTTKGELVLIGNGKLYGGNYSIFEEADLRDGLLDIAVFSKVGWLTLARCGPSLLWNQKLPSGVAEHFQARSVRLTSSAPASFEVDGELVGRLPTKFSISPCPLTVLVP